MLGRGWRRGRGGSRSREWFTATIHHAHFSTAALADRGTHLGVRYADAIDQLTSQTTSLANWNDRIVQLLKWGVQHTLCFGHNAQRSATTAGLIICIFSSVTESYADDFSIGFEHYWPEVSRRSVRIVPAWANIVAVGVVAAAAAVVGSRRSGADRRRTGP